MCWIGNQGFPRLWLRVLHTRIPSFAIAPFPLAPLFETVCQFTKMQNGKNAKMFFPIFPKIRHLRHLIPWCLWNFCWPFAGKINIIIYNSYPKTWIFSGICWLFTTIWGFFPLSFQRWMVAIICPSDDEIAFHAPKVVCHSSFATLDPAKRCSRYSMCIPTFILGCPTKLGSMVSKWLITYL